MQVWRFLTLLLPNLLSSWAPNAYLNVALGWNTHPALPLLPALLSRLGSFLLDGKATFVCTSGEPRASHGWWVMRAGFGLQQKSFLGQSHLWIW